MNLRENNTQNDIIRINKMFRQLQCIYRHQILNIAQLHIITPARPLLGAI